MELQKLGIPGKMELRILKPGACGELQILDLGPRMELRIRPGNCYEAALWELEIVNFFIFRLARNEEVML